MHRGLTNSVQYTKKVVGCMNLAYVTGETVWKPVCVFKPKSDNSEANNSEKSVLSIEELKELSLRIMMPLPMYLVFFYTKATLVFGHR